MTAKSHKRRIRNTILAQAGARLAMTADISLSIDPTDDRGSYIIASYSCRTLTIVGPYKFEQPCFFHCATTDADTFVGIISSSEFITNLLNWLISGEYIKEKS